MNHTEYLNTRIVELITNAEGFDQIMLENAEKIKTILTSVSSRKRNEENLTHKEVAKDLTEVQEKHYTNFFIEQNMKSTLSAIIELMKMAEETKTELELTEDQNSVLKAIQENHKDLYTVKNGKLEITDADLYAKISEGLKEKLSQEEGLKNIFNSIV